jgi:hypothetical protein
MPGSAPQAALRVGSVPMALQERRPPMDLFSSQLLAPLASRHTILSFHVLCVCGEKPPVAQRHQDQLT